MISRLAPYGAHDSPARSYASKPRTAIYGAQCTTQDSCAHMLAITQVKLPHMLSWLGFLDLTALLKTTLILHIRYVQDNATLQRCTVPGDGHFSEPRSNVAPIFDQNLFTNATIFLALTTSSFPPTPLHPRLPVCKLRCCSTRKVHKHPSQFGTSTTRTGHQVRGKNSSQKRQMQLTLSKKYISASI